MPHVPARDQLVERVEREDAVEIPGETPLRVQRLLLPVVGEKVFPRRGLDKELECAVGASAHSCESRPSSHKPLSTTRRATASCSSVLSPPGKSHGRNSRSDTMWRNAGRKRRAKLSLVGPKLSVAVSSS